jgi:hypothetical protein
MTPALSESAILVLVFVVGLSLVVFGFHCLDEWHKRKAWRDADRKAREWMRRHQNQK